MIFTAANWPQITQAFIESMFDHPFFRQKFSDLTNTTANIKAFPFFSQTEKQTFEIIEQITQTIYQSVIQPHRQISSKFQEQITNLHQQIQRLKDLSYQSIGRIDDVAKQFTEESILEDEHIFDMPSMQRTISFLKGKVREISQNSTVMLESSQVSKELREREQFYIDKLTSELNEMEQKLSLQHEAHTEAISKKIEVVNKKIEKQQKTINNILDTLNELSGPDKRDKTAATLSSCKSATKLKNFFGFG